MLRKFNRFFSLTEVKATDGLEFRLCTTGITGKFMKVENIFKMNKKSTGTSESNQTLQHKPYLQYLRKVVKETSMNLRIF